MADDHEDEESDRSTVRRERPGSPDPTGAHAPGASTAATERLQPAGDDARTPPRGAAPGAAARIANADGAERYVQRSLLGEGGMGEVRLCTDRRIGRDVAMKIIRPSEAGDADLVTRFEREARVQGRLEHPAIVPVYDLGAGPDGAYFTMKRVRGHTLEEILAGQRDGDPAYVDGYSLRRLLTAFAQIGLAVAFAHSRGVIHRDLKPSNVMLGDFGEVYVLDWGLAKLLPLADEAAPPGVEGPRSNDGAEDTDTGVVLGTPGYISPEQALGNAARLDERSDVYTLGLILFEILTLQPLHARANAQTAVALALREADVRPSARAPDRGIPPELDAICERAAAFVPEDRYQNALELVAALEQYLDGDRDLARRRELAEKHLEAARSAAARAVEGGAPVEARSAALRDLNRALALDPGNQEATGALAQLLLLPTEEPPAEAEAEVSRSLDEERRATARVGMLTFAAWTVLSPLLFWPGVRSWSSWLAVVSLAALSGAICAILVFRGRRITDLAGAAVLVTSTAATGVFAMHLGPLVLVPAMAAQNTLVFALHAPRGIRRAGTVALGTLAVLVPLGLELAGVLPPSLVFRDGELVLLPRMVDLPPVPTMTLLVLASVALVIVPSIAVARLSDELLAAKRRIFTHLWHLRQLVPAGARKATLVHRR